MKKGWNENRLLGEQAFLLHPTPFSRSWNFSDLRWPMA